MSRLATAAAIWGRVLVHNKLLTPKQWEDAVAAFKQSRGQVPIEDILLRKRYITARGVEIVGAKVEELLAKHESAAQTSPGTRAPSAPPDAPTKPSASVPVAPPPATDDEDDAEPVQLTESDESGDDDEPTTGAADAKPGEDKGAIDLAGEDDGEAAWGWKPSDAEWVESSGHTETATRAEGWAEDAIDLVDDLEDDAQPSSKIIKQEDVGIGALKKPDPADGGKKSKIPRVELPGEPPRGVAKPVESHIDADSGDERIESPVAPGDIDPTALAVLKKAVEIHASDVHLASGSPPFFRLHGQLVFTQMEPLTPDVARRMVLGFMNDEQQQHYLRQHDLDFSFEQEGLGRFRVNALEEFRGPAIIFRVIPAEVPTLQALNLPETLERFTEWHQGLVLVTGPAGSGKTTTAAALLNLINQKRRDHIITVEDPIEFLHYSSSCNVTQRQVPIHTLSFAAALRAALREDPDVIFIGEMRDLETMSLAIRAAETGHLVFGTLQTKNAPRTIDRIVDVFPSDQQAQIRTMLSESLRGVISQNLVPRKDGNGRVVALEVLFVNNAVSNLIRDSKTFQLHSLMQTGKRIGQKLMDDSLQELIDSGTITREDAAKVSENPKKFGGSGDAAEVAAGAEAE